ncbi:Ammonia transport outward protein 2 [Hypsizygus marmoreus]|uniref:Ammonia transport outward protein 2 n=1 Tax=Hypsizygus marmoreus TaxID=39966 RepID=A0A369K952_HYPMA|nr:Ammonia transport outward protein 2 [Hypsizygus marmoreus]
MPGHHDIEKASIEATSPGEALGHTNGSAAPYRPRPSSVGNPGSLGLFSFASTTFILSMFNLQTRDITHPNVVIGMAIFCGGLAQLLAGMWEFPRGNVFGGTAFTSYGAFWMSYATILIPGSGVLTAYGTNKAELQSALGIFLIAWTMVTLIFFIVSFGKNIAFLALFGLLTITFALLAAGELADSVSTAKAGGGLGVIVAFIAYYTGISELLSSEATPPFRLPIGLLHQNTKKA